MKSSKAIVLAAFVLTTGSAVLIAAQGPPPSTTQAPATAPAPAAEQQGGRGGRGGRGAPAGGGGFANAYPQHAQAAPEKIAAGKILYDQNCAFCHGPDARGGEGGGPNLLRSEMVMDDQDGELIAPVVQNGRAAMPKFDLTADQISNISAYIHSFRVAGYDLSRMVPTNIVVGNAQAGEAFFNGPVGKCNTCHSVTGDLAGIGGRMEPKLLQNAIVSGRAGGRGGFGAAPEANPRTTVTVTVSLTNGKTVEGKLDHLDDFTVTLTDANDNHLTYSRSHDVKDVVVHNPLQFHIDMLPKWTDDEIHNLTAYLVTLK